jgi:hypothetical protein
MMATEQKNTNQVNLGLRIKTPLLASSESITALNASNQIGDKIQCHPPRLAVKHLSPENQDGWEGFP